MRTKAAIYGGVTPDADRLNGGVGGMVGGIFCTRISCTRILEFSRFRNPILDGDSAVAIFGFASSVCHVWRRCGRRHDGEMILVFRAFQIILGPASHATVLHGQINVQNQVRCLVS